MLCPEILSRVFVIRRLIGARGVTLREFAISKSWGAGYTGKKTPYNTCACKQTKSPNKNS